MVHNKIQRKNIKIVSVRSPILYYEVSPKLTEEELLIIITPLKVHEWPVKHIEETYLQVKEMNKN